MKMSTSALALTELMEQPRKRLLSFEGQRLGDARCNSGAVLHIPTSGSTYFKLGYSAIGSDVCLPIPLTETLSNPNFPKS